MKKKTLPLIFLAALFCSFIGYVIVSSYQKSVEKDKRLHDQMALIGKIQFKGHIVNKKIYVYAGKNYYLICIKLDYSNTGDIYIYNDICCLKIKKGIATITAGFYEPALGNPTYAEVNINYNHKIKTTYKDGSSVFNVLTLDPYGVSEKDMNTCN